MSMTKANVIYSATGNNKLDTIHIYSPAKKYVELASLENPK